MSDNVLVEQFKLLKRAKKVEQMGNTERALDLYLELHERYEPNTSDAYERPAVLLERKKDYQAALAMCQKAIEAIDNDKMSGTKDKFQKRIDAINEKLKDQPVEEVKVSSYITGLVGFRSSSNGKKITAIIFYLVFALLGFLLKSFYPTILMIALVHFIAFGVDLLNGKAKDHKKKVLPLLLLSLLLLVFSAINLPAAVERVIELESSDASLEGGDQIFTDSEEDLPLISESRIKEAIDLISSEIEVKDAVIQVSGDSITFGLLLMPATDPKRAEALSEDFIEILAHRVSDDGEVKAPNFNSHGELYDYYNFIITAGSDDQTLLSKGKKNKTSSFITWLD